ncbi:hypothetical protein D7Y21_27570 [Corallococcus sp. AB045]|nr:hypothetical protein D7Y21_27570 [Corallococcus sp. AB045]
MQHAPLVQDPGAKATFPAFSDRTSQDGWSVSAQVSSASPSTQLSTPAWSEPTSTWQAPGGRR